MSRDRKFNVKQSFQDGNSFRLACLATSMLAFSFGITPSVSKAQDFPPFEMSVIGHLATAPQTIAVEKPGFEAIEENSGGKVDSQYRTFDELGLDGSELLRLVSRGDFDIGSLLGGYISGDAPFFMGLDIPGLAGSLEDAKAQADAFEGALDRYLQGKLNLRLLAVFPSPLQLLYCREPVTSLEDLNGRRIRVHATVLATLVEQIGGIAVSIDFAEVYTALQRGVADCAATSSTGGNSQKWYEVTSQLVTLPLGWAMSGFVANADFWDGLDASQQAFLESEIAKIEQGLWDFSRARGEDALSCNMGGECEFGSKASEGEAMTIYRLTDEELQQVREMVAGSVLVDWVSDCAAGYEQCAEIWNATVGEVVGVSAAE